jgi:hypothetical protein
MTDLPLAFTLEAFTDLGFWSGVLVIAGIYAVVTLGLQLNVGYTGIVNFGQAGFMAVGAYSMAIMVLEAGISFWLAMPLAVLITMGFGVLVGLPALRLRSDYFAIVTLATAEVVRLAAQNARDLTGGNKGLYCNFEGGNQACFDDSWRSVSDSILGFVENFWSDPVALLPLLLVVWTTVVVGTLALGYVQRTPWGRVLPARSARTPSSTSSSRWRSPPCSARSQGSSSPYSSPRSRPTTTSPSSPSSPSACSSSAGSPATAGWRSARSSSGSCWKEPATSNCRSARRRRRRCASR